MRRRDTGRDPHMASAGSVPIYLLFANEQAGTITLDFVLAEAAQRSDGSTISAGQPFAASFTQLSGCSIGQTMRTLESWASRSRTVQAISGIDAESRHLLVLSQDDRQVVLEYW